MSSFSALKYCSLVTFDFGCSLTERNARNLLIEKLKQDYPSCHVKEEDYDDRIYDCEFIRFSKGKESIIVKNVRTKEIHEHIKEFNESETDDTNKLSYLGQYCPDELDYHIVFDSYTIGTANIHFIVNDIDVETSIKLLNEFGRFVDKWLFPKYLFPKARSCLDAVLKNRTTVLNEHHTYHVLITNDAEKNKPSPKECYGLVWSDINYEQASEEWVTGIVDNIAIDSNDKLIISQPATFMSFKGTTFGGTFIKSHIESIEILRRLHHLLKKFDYQLSEILKRKNVSNPGEAIKEIIRIQDQTIQLVEYFLKPKATATEQFAYIMDKGAKVFKMVDLYDNVKTKLDISYDFLNDLIQERRNRILLGVQVIGLFFASVSVVKILIPDLLDSIYNQPWQWLGTIKSFFGAHSNVYFDVFACFLLTLFGLLLFNLRKILNAFIALSKTVISWTYSGVCWMLKSIHMVLSKCWKSISEFAITNYKESEKFCVDCYQKTKMSMAGVFRMISQKINNLIVKTKNLIKDVRNLSIKFTQKTQN